jgi:hypothetical protein
MIGQPFWIDLETCQGLHAGSRAPRRMLRTTSIQISSEMYVKIL